jgi:hypothetical protein
MSIWAKVEGNMKTGTSLSGPSLFQSVRELFRKFPDFRNRMLIEIPIEDFLMSGLAIFQLKFSSLLNFETEMKREDNFSNLKSLFGVTKVPSDTHTRSVIDKIEPRYFRQIFLTLFIKAQRAKVL